MSAIIKEITEREKWDAFLRPLNPNTFLQSWEWGQLQKFSGEDARYLGFFEAGDQIGATLLLTVKARRGRHLFCPHGPVFNSEEQTRRHVPAFINYCRRIAAAENAVAVRIAPLLLASEENADTFRRLNFRPAPLHVHAERTWNLDITPAEDELLAGMRKTTRHAVKKAEKAGVAVCTVTGPDIVRRFMSLYSATRSRHDFVPFGRKFLSEQARLFGKENNLYAVFASYNGEDVAAAILVQYGSTVFYHHGASVKKTNLPPAAQLVQWKAIKEARRRGAVRYNFWGIAPENKPDHPFAGITVFKKGFGGYELNYMHAQDLPLSMLYYKLWLVETLRRRRRGF